MATRISSTICSAPSAMPSRAVPPRKSSSSCWATPRRASRRSPTPCGRRSVTTPQDIKVDTFLRQETGRTRGDLLRLDGVRMGILAEAVRGMRMDEGLLKAFVSAEPLTARKLYNDERTFMPITKPFMHTNYMPRMSEDDDAIWRRARILPFTHRPQHIDKSIKPTVCNPAISGAAILSWLVEGCLYLAA